MSVQTQKMKLAIGCLAILFVNCNLVSAQNVAQCRQACEKDSNMFSSTMSIVGQMFGFNACESCLEDKKFEPAMIMVTPGSVYQEEEEALILPTSFDLDSPVQRTEYPLAMPPSFATHKRSQPQINPVVNLVQTLRQRATQNRILNSATECVTADVNCEIRKQNSTRISDAAPTKSIVPINRLKVTAIPGVKRVYRLPQTNTCVAKTSNTCNSTKCESACCSKEKNEVAKTCCNGSIQKGNAVVLSRGCSQCKLSCQCGTNCQCKTGAQATSCPCKNCRCNDQAHVSVSEIKTPEQLALFITTVTRENANDPSRQPLVDSLIKVASKNFQMHMQLEMAQQQMRMAEQMMAIQIQRASLEASLDAHRTIGEFRYGNVGYAPAAYNPISRVHPSRSNGPKFSPYYSHPLPPANPNVQWQALNPAQTFPASPPILPQGCSPPNPSNSPTSSTSTFQNVSEELSD